MLTLHRLYDRAQKLDTDRVIEQALDDTSKQFAEANRDQLNHGFGRDGKRLGRYKNSAYAAKKNRMNSLPGYGNPDLKLSGDYQRGIFMTANGDQVLTGSLDRKDLEGRYPTALGLGGEFKDAYLKNSLAPAIQEGIAEVLGLKFGG